MLRSILPLIGCLITAALPATAQQQASMSQNASGKFRVDGTHLYYDTFNAAGDAAQRIEPDDVDKLQALLRNRPDITTIVLNSSGGGLWAGEEMGRIVLDFALDTHVEGQCSSSCVTIFLAGETRTMARGSKIGFHQSTWSEAHIQSYYKSWYGDENGWENPFAFASWIYQDTQTQVHEQLVHMLERGVDPAFAIATRRPVMELWFPTRRELEQAGVLRE